jgi:hypothetical protein
MIYRLAQSPKMETKKRQDRFFIYFIYIYIYKEINLIRNHKEVQPMYTWNI